MGKREQYINYLRPVLARDAGAVELEAFLLSNSNLPGPRANLELASALADCFEEPAVAESHVESLWRWSAISPQEAGVNDPVSFLTFCAVISLGACYLSASAGDRERILGVLKASASDPRWRSREAAAFAFQRIGQKDFGVIRDEFSSWVETATLMEMRTIEAALAHPPILDDRNTAEFCLQMTDEILRHVEALGADERKSEEFRILRKGLEYTISVFAAGSPEAGFAFLRRWAQSDDPAIVRIIASNLTKARLARHYAEEVMEIQSLISGDSGP